MAFSKSGYTFIGKTIPCLLSLSVPPGFSKPRSILSPPDSSPHPVFIPNFDAYLIEEKHSAPDKRATSVSPLTIFSDSILIKY